jgi:hypothetical protein
VSPELRDDGACGGFAQEEVDQHHLEVFGVQTPQSGVGVLGGHDLDPGLSQALLEEGQE